MVVQRTHRQPLNWFSDGWMGYQELLRKAYRQQVRAPWQTGARAVGGSRDRELDENAQASRRAWTPDLD
jgi:hypothetical protein